MENQEKVSPRMLFDNFENSPNPNSLFQMCARIYCYFDSDRAEEQVIALFEAIDHHNDSPSETVAQHILKAARELRRLIIENKVDSLLISREEAIGIAGRLFELAINQTTLEKALELVHETTLFYLIVGKSDLFLKWSQILLEHVGDDHPEHRATVFSIGLTQVFIGEATQAELTFRRLVHTFPEAAESYLGLCLTYLKLNEKVKYFHAYTQLLSLAPELAFIANSLSKKEDFTAEDYAIEMEALEEHDHYPENSAED